MMKKLLSLFLFFSASFSVFGQIDVYAPLRAGEAVAKEYLDSYMRPGVSAVAYNLAAGWITDARAKPFLDFQVNINIQGTFAGTNNRSFSFDPQRYSALAQQSYDENSTIPAEIQITFDDGSTAPRNVSTVFGDNNPDQFILVRSVDPVTGAVIQEERIRLADGADGGDINFVSLAFLQGSIGLGKGFEVKARLVPQFEVEGTEAFLVGGGLQYEFSRLFYPEYVEPIVVFSALGSYTYFNAQYDFNDGTIIAGENQRGESDVNVYTASVIAGTNFDILNVFGSVGYMRATSKGSILGSYILSSDSPVFPTQTIINDPVEITEQIENVMATLGVKLQLGFFLAEASYTYSEFSTAHVGLGVTF
jgi:hypothetical protein